MLSIYIKLINTQDVSILLNPNSYVDVKNMYKNIIIEEFKMRRKEK